MKASVTGRKGVFVRTLLITLLLLLPAVEANAAAAKAAKPAPVPAKVATPAPKPAPAKAPDYDLTSAVRLSVVLATQNAAPAYEEIDDATFAMISKYAPCLKDDSCLEIRIFRRPDKPSPNASPQASQNKFFYAVHSHSVVLGATAKDDKIVSSRKRVTDANVALFDKVFTTYKAIKAVRLDLDALTDSDEHVLKIETAPGRPYLKALYESYMGMDDEVLAEDEAEECSQ